MFEAKSLTRSSSLMRSIIAVQTSINKSHLVLSDRRASHIRNTSGKGNSCESISESHHHSGDSRFCFIQSFDEEIPDIRHEGGEAEEAVSFSIFSPFYSRVGGEDVVNGSYDFVHTLHVTLSRIEFCVEKKYSFHHLPMCFLTIFERCIVLHGSFFGCCHLDRPNSFPL